MEQSVNFSAYSIRNPIPAVLLFILLTVAGLMAFNKTMVQDFPDMDFPVVVVTIAQPGAAPAQLETQVARKVEDTIATVTGIENMYSTVIDGSVTTTVQFRLEKNLTDAVSEVRDAISLIRSDLPAGNPRTHHHQDHHQRTPDPRLQRTASARQRLGRAAAELVCR